MYQETKPIEHDRDLKLTRPSILKEKVSLTEGKIKEINNKLDELTKILNPILRIDNERSKEVRPIPESETKLLTSLAIIEEDVTYLLDSIIL